MDDTLPRAKVEFDRIIRSAELPAGVRIDVVPDDEWEPRTKAIMGRAFANRRSLTREELFGPEVCSDAERIADLEGETMVEHRYGFWVGDELVGFYQGRQSVHANYVMYGTAILPEWQKKGIYSALLPKVIEGARATGFIKVMSQHFPDDNIMLAAKISRGFVIKGIALSLNAGPLVELVYYLHTPIRER